MRRGCEARGAWRSLSYASDEQRSQTRMQRRPKSGSYSFASPKVPRALLAFLFVTCAGPALAAGPASAPIAEIERGLYIQGMVGSKIFVMPPAHSGDEHPLLRGTSLGLAVGYDVMDALQAEAFVAGAQVRAPASYRGLGRPGDPHGDFSSFLVGAKGRFAVLALPDAQDVRRLHLTVNGGAGLMATRPASILESGRPAVLGGVGAHYFTRLRHFVVGFEVDALYGLGAGAFVILPQARLSYTF